MEWFSIGPYGVRIDNLLSIARSFVGGGSVPRSESPDGAGSYRTAPRGPLFRAQARKSVVSYPELLQPRRAPDSSSALRGEAGRKEWSRGYELGAEVSAASRYPHLPGAVGRRFACRCAGLCPLSALAGAECIGPTLPGPDSSTYSYASPLAIASASPGHASRTILQSRRASARSPRSSARAARLRRVRRP